MSTEAVLREELTAGGKWSGVLRRHQVLHLKDLRGGANVSALFYNRDLLLERYNMPDTLKAQYTAFLTEGRVLMSDMGRALCSVVQDDAGWHDTLAGHTDARMIEAKYGAKRYQEARNAYLRNARDAFLVELAKWGLGVRDLVPNVNFFSKVVASDGGALAFVPGHSKAGAQVALRAEMNVLVVLSTAPHPLDPRPAYPESVVEVRVTSGPPPAEDDRCRVSRAETRRAFENTEAFFT